MLPLKSRKLPVYYIASTPVLSGTLQMALVRRKCRVLLSATPAYKSVGTCPTAEKPVIIRPCLPTLQLYIKVLPVPSGRRRSCRAAGKRKHGKCRDRPEICCATTNISLLHQRRALELIEAPGPEKRRVGSSWGTWVPGPETPRTFPPLSRMIPYQVLGHSRPTTLHSPLAYALQLRCSTSTFISPTTSILHHPSPIIYLSSNAIKQLPLRHFLHSSYSHQFLSLFTPFSPTPGSSRRQSSSPVDDMAWPMTQHYQRLHHG